MQTSVIWCCCDELSIRESLHCTCCIGRYCACCSWTLLAPFMTKIWGDCRTYIAYSKCYCFGEFDILEAKRIGWWLLPSKCMCSSYTVGRNALYNNLSLSVPFTSTFDISFAFSFIYIYIYTLTVAFRSINLDCWGRSFINHPFHSASNQNLLLVA